MSFWNPQVKSTEQNTLGQFYTLQEEKPTIGSLASIVAERLPGPMNNTTENPYSRPLPVAPIVLALPLAINISDIPPDDLPPIFDESNFLPPDDLPPTLITTGKEVNDTAINVINSNPFITNSSSCRTNSSPKSSKPVDNKQSPEELETLVKMAKLRERADLNSLEAMSRDLLLKIKSEAANQGYIYDASYQFYVKGELAKTQKDFMDEIAEEDLQKFRVCIQQVLEEKERQEALLKENDLHIAQALAQEEQVKTAAAGEDPKCILSDECLKLLQENGWQLNFNGGFGIDPAGDALSFEFIKNIYDRD